MPPLKQPGFLGFFLLVFAAPCLLAGQSQNQAEPSQPAPQAKPAKPKKVWTEDDIGKLNGPVSVVGQASAPRSPHSEKPASGDAAYYRERLEPLRAELQQIEDKRREIQTAKLGGRENIGRMMEDLDTRKRKVQDRIDALEEQARKAGIDLSQLR